MAISYQLAQSVSKGMQEQMDRCPYHDVIVIVDETEFKCHRFLLSSSSEFFRALFQSGMKEDLDNKVVLRNMSSNVFKLIIDSVYFAKGILTPDNVSSVWHAANLLQIRYLLEACEIFQCKRLSRENCVSIYIDSKFLSSKTLQDLSWDFIIKEFDYLSKSEDILYLDFEDMKRLIRDDNLTISSEDVVIETVMRWVKFSPNEYLLGGFKDADKACELSQGESTDAKTSISTDQMKEDLKDSQDRPKNQQLHSDNLLQNTHDSDCKQTSANFNLNNRREDAVSSRSEFLYELLTAGKLFLVSHTCLINLLGNKLILEDPKSFAFVREGFKFNLQLGTHQSYCPSYSIYRNTSLLQNVIFTISNSNPMKHLCRTIDEKWFLMVSEPDLKCKAVTYGNDIYWTAATGHVSTVSRYETSLNKWKQIASLNVLREDHALVCLDNYIYAIGGIDCITIERFDVEAERKVSGSGKWDIFGNLVQPMTNLMATTCGDMIVIFGSDIEDSPSTIVQTFTTHPASANIHLNNMSGSAKNMVAFKHGEDTFVLQENGALWKMNLDSNLLLNIEFHTMLWADSLSLTGAVIMNQELLIFGEDFDQLILKEWDICTFEHLKKIKLIQCKGYFFLNLVIPKKFLVTPG